MANRHPELTIIAAHAGAPWVVETIAIAVRHPNVYIDISSLPAMRGGLAKLVLMLCYEHGLEDRVLFGTDFPLVDPARYVGLLHGLNPNPLVRWPFKLKRVTPEMREKLLGGNAQRLLKLGAH